MYPHCPESMLFRLKLQTGAVGESVGSKVLHSRSEVYWLRYPVLEPVGLTGLGL